MKFFSLFVSVVSFVSISYQAATEYNENSPSISNPLAILPPTVPQILQQVVQVASQEEEEKEEEGDDKVQVENYSKEEYREMLEELVNGLYDNSEDDNGNGDPVSFLELIDDACVIS